MLQEPATLKLVKHLVFESTAPGFHAILAGKAIDGSAIVCQKLAHGVLQPRIAEMLLQRSNFHVELGPQHIHNASERTAAMKQNVGDLVQESCRKDDVLRDAEVAWVVLH